MSDVHDRIQWLAEVVCPRCTERVSVPVLVSGIRLVPRSVDGPTRWSSLVVDFQPADVAHQCPDPTMDRTGAARLIPVPRRLS